MSAIESLRIRGDAVISGRVVEMDPYDSRGSSVSDNYVTGMVLYSTILWIQPFKVSFGEFIPTSSYTVCIHWEFGSQPLRVVERWYLISENELFEFMHFPQWMYRKHWQSPSVSTYRKGKILGIKPDWRIEGF